MRRAPIVATVLSLVGGASALRPVDSLDLWWHLDQGRAALEHGARRYPDPSGLPEGLTYTNPEWVFDVALYGVHSAGGLLAVQLMVGLLAGLSALLAFLLARRFADLHTSALLTAVVIGATSWRFAPRPQSLFLVLLPLTLLLAASGSTAKRRLPWLAAVLAVLVVWSQSHSSMVIGPVVALLVGLHTAESRRDRVWVGGLVAGLAVPLLGPFGLDVISQVLGHAGTDAARHIADMRPMPLAAWWPLPGNSVLYVEALALAVVVGLVLRRRVPLPLLLVAVLGLAMTITAHRFRAAWALLLVPAVAALWPTGGPGRVAVGLVGLVLLFARQGLPSAGWERGSVPIGGAQAIAALELNGPLFNSYNGGGYLGWTLHGRNRVIIDGRTPTHFDDERYFAVRRAMKEPGVFEGLNRSHGFVAALVPRDEPLCDALAADGRWRPVWTGARETLFTTEDRPALEVMGLCGVPGQLARCRASEPARFRAELERVVAASPDDDGVLRMAALLYSQCWGDGSARALVDRARALAPESPRLPLVLAYVLLGEGDPQGAIAALEGADDDAARTLRFILLAEHGDPARALAAGEALAETDDFPAAQRCTLAQLAHAQGELELATRQAVRASLSGTCGSLVAELDAHLTQEQRRLTRGTRGQ